MPRDEHGVPRDEYGKIVLNPLEQRAVRAAERLAKNWPSSLTLASMGGRLIIFRNGGSNGQEDTVMTGGGGSGVDPDYEVGTMPGVPNTGGDW